MKRFLVFAGGVLALYLAVLAVVLATAPEHDREGAFAMGFGGILVMGAMVSAGVIALGGALMLLWARFIAKSPKVSRVGVLFAGVILAGLAVAVMRPLFEPSYAEKQAVLRAEELRKAIETHDVDLFSRAVFDRLRDGREEEAESLIAAGPFTEEEFIRHLLATHGSMNPEQHTFLVRLGARHPDVIAQLPYRSRVRYRSYERFGTGDPLWGDDSGLALFNAFQTVHEAGGTPESIAPVFKAVDQLSANIRSSASPLYLLVTIPYLKVYRTANEDDLFDDGKARRRSALVLLKQRGLELNAEEKQDAELQSALRSSDLTELLE